MKSFLKKSSFVIILLLGIAAGSFAFASINSVLSQEKAPAHNYPKNEHGETYGSLLDASPNEKVPDLIKAVGEDGSVGYVRSNDLIGEAPKTPEEALAQQANQHNINDIPLYDVDGKTIIGKFKMQTEISSQINAEK